MQIKSLIVLSAAALATAQTSPLGDLTSAVGGGATSLLSSAVSDASSAPVHSHQLQAVPPLLLVQLHRVQRLSTATSAAAVVASGATSGAAGAASTATSGAAGGLSSVTGGANSAAASATSAAGSATSAAGAAGVTALPTFVGGLMMATGGMVALL
ncbi:hypothetical protein B0A48_05949 [Cryoendolithus antarcticus]|uniref:Uncharacterized protein n=1 Tax=Cryoendolithus antarcticus TaxID=1507870 RepID=A0A1V8TCS0_9PEZI|nr:hypothetical protein B0A48_05949 [Cryoendolithus antarcticus]